MQCTARLGKVSAVRFATRPVSVGPADDSTVLEIGIQNIMRDIEIRMVASIVLVVLDLLLRRVDLRHCVKTCPACRRLLHPQYSKYSVEPLMGCALVLCLCLYGAKHRDHDQ